MKHIGKHRLLDKYGKDMVDTVLDKELMRCKDTRGSWGFSVIFNIFTQAADSGGSLPILSLAERGNAYEYIWDTNDYFDNSQLNRSNSQIYK